MKITKGELLNLLNEQKIDGIDGDKKNELVNKYRKSYDTFYKFYEKEKQRILNLSIFEIVNNVTEIELLSEKLREMMRQVETGGEKLYNYYDTFDDMTFHELYVSYDKLGWEINDFVDSLDILVSDDIVKVYTNKGQ